MYLSLSATSYDMLSLSYRILAYHAVKYGTRVRRLPMLHGGNCRPPTKTECKTQPSRLIRASVAVACAIQRAPSAGARAEWVRVDRLRNVVDLRGRSIGDTVSYP